MNLGSFLVGLYLGTLALLALFGLHRLWLLARFRWPAGRGLGARGASVLPTVTVQLPLFNERTVAARLIRSVGALDYPAERLEIQVLDDSGDETRAIADAEVERLRALGIDAKVVRRADRTGYKAGALAHGLTTALGELIAVFDADFTPRPDFLRRLVPAFGDPRVGMIQARWEHANRDESPLTRAQSVLLDGHFVIEHKVRHDHGLFFNFNGTGGIWRRAAIEGGGGWQHDTLTEDLDLSYRAQLAGWRMAYAPDVTVPGEVPADLAAFLGQQQRWAKGSVQVARKLLARIASAELPVAVKVEGFAHLLGNSGYPLVLLMAGLLPWVATRDTHLGPRWHLAAFLVCTLSVLLFYERGLRAVGRRPGQRLFDLVAALVLGVGMSASQTRAVLEGLFSGTGEFVRTPKRGDAPPGSRYRSARRGWPVLELAFAAWFGWGILVALLAGLWGSLPFLTLYFLGFLWVGALSLAGRSAAAQRSSVELAGAFGPASEDPCTTS